MTSITQTIPSLIGGISQQPDQLMLPGTVKELVNLIPDITEGLVKRPSSQYLNTLNGATNDGAWFSYYRDQVEGAYIGQVQRNGTVNVWHANDYVYTDTNGTTVTVSAGSSVLVIDASVHTGYLAHNASNALKFLTVADTTFVTNTTIPVQIDTNLLSSTRAASVGRSSTTSTDITVEADDEHFQAYVELRQVSHGRHYAFDVASPSAPEAYTTGSAATGSAARGPVTKISLGVETDSPFHQVNRNNTIQDSAGKNLGISRNTSGNSYQGLDPQLPYQGSEIVTCTSGTGSGMIVRLTNVGQVNVSRYVGSSINGSEYVGTYNTSVELLHGGDGYRLLTNSGTQSYATAVLKGVTYKIFIEEIQPIKTKLDLGTFRPEPTSFDGNHTISADSVLDLDKAISSLTPHVEKIGNGFFLSHSSAFNVTSPEPDLWRITSTEVNDVSELPRQCKHGMVVKVVNSSDSQEDDFYLKFAGDNDTDGPGKWEETLRPSSPSVDVYRRIDSSSLPVVIQRRNTAPVSFKVKIPTANNSAIAWEDREVGDDNTNPFPTFIGRKLSQTFFHRNRLGFLCDDNVILSQADKIYNFFNNTALVVSGNDPIDIASSSTQPTKFIDCIETNTGLLIFGETQQFMLHTDSDSLTPDTAKLSNISTYRYTPEASPISLGTTVGFLDTAGSYSRFFEMFDIKREGEPQIVDVTKVVAKLLPSGIDILSISRENNMIFFSEGGKPDMYLYRYFNTGSERLQGAWFKWQFPFNIKYTFVLDDNLYLVASDLKLYTLNLQPNFIQADGSNGSTLATDLFTTNTFDKLGYPLATEIHLDAAAFLTAGTYNSNDNTTNVSWPGYIGLIDVNGSISIDTVFAVDPDTGERFTVKSSNGSNYVFHGNFAGKAIVIGHAVVSTIQFPTFYVRTTSGNKTTSDITASLVIQRIHYNFEHLSSLSTFDIVLGSPSSVGNVVSIEKPMTPINRYEADNTLGDKNVTVTIPVYQRNTNLSCNLDSPDPGPFSLTSVTWEGDYTPMNHKRV